MKRFAVIGLGSFGFHAAKALCEDGNEVIAVDSDRGRVQAISPYCTEALVPESFILVPPADFVIKDSDILMMLGKTEDIRKIKALK